MDDDVTGLGLRLVLTTTSRLALVPPVTAAACLTLTTTVTGVLRKRR